MKLIKNFILIFFFLIISSQNSFANKINYIDIDFIIKNSERGKLIIQNLEKINKKNIEELKNEQKSLLDLEKDIKNKKNILSEDEINKKINDLNLKVKNFNVKKSKINKEYNKMEQTELNNFFAKVEKLIANYVKEKSIDLLIDKKTVFVGITSLDVTDDVLNLVNKNIK